MSTNMNRYVFIYYGHDTSSPDLERAGTGGSPSEQITSSTRANPSDPAGRSRQWPEPTCQPSTLLPAGYPIVQAATLQDAERLLEGCPIVDSCRIYETIAV
jgi:hypothetical protein